MQAKNNGLRPDDLLFNRFVISHNHCQLDTFSRFFKPAHTLAALGGLSF